MKNVIIVATSFLAVAVMLAAAVVPAVAQEKRRTPPNPPSATKDQTSANDNRADSQGRELEAIRHASRDFTVSFNNGDAKAIAAHWAEEGDYVDESGRRFAGQAEIAQEYARFFAEHRGTKIQIIIDSLRLLNETSAIEDGRAILEPPPAGAPAISKYTAVHVKVDGKWLMSTVRDTRIETSSAYRNVEDLEFLIGTWTAEEHGAKTESVCRWVANKSFVQRSYSVTHPDQSTTSGIQLIGFNPQEGHIQSWNFSSDGGHAVGVWTSSEKGWSARIHGMLGDGTDTTATNLLTRLDDNAYTWQSVQRTAGGVELPDTDEVVLKRRARE